jgi:hypothetical protein
VEATRNKKDGSLVGRALVGRIRRLIDLDWEVNVQHVYRESNQCVNALANISCNMLTDVCFFESCPSQISHLMITDMLRIASPKVVFL